MKPLLDRLRELINTSVAPGIRVVDVIPEGQPGLAWQDDLNANARNAQNQYTQNQYTQNQYTQNVLNQLTQLQAMAQFPGVRKPDQFAATVSCTSSGFQGIVQRAAQQHAQGMPYSVTIASSLTATSILQSSLTTPEDEHPKIDPRAFTGEDPKCGKCGATYFAAMIGRMNCLQCGAPLGEEVMPVAPRLPPRRRKKR